MVFVIALEKKTKKRNKHKEKYITIKDQLADSYLLNYSTDTTFRHVFVPSSGTETSRSLNN